MTIDKGTVDMIEEQEKWNEIKKSAKRAAIRGIPKIAMGVCVDRVVSRSINKMIPPSANLKTRIMFRIASLGISTAATHIVSKEMDEIFDGVEETVEMISVVRETVNEINEEEIQNDGYYEEDSEE